MSVVPLPISRPLAGRSLRIDGQTLRVFVCDDDLEFASEIASALTSIGCQVRTLKDGNSPVEIFELFQPDIVFLDIFMPPPDGFEVMNHIGQDTRKKSLSLVLVSGADGTLLEVARRFCQVRGIKTAGVLRKPIQLKTVVEICKNHPGQGLNP
jgi:CheY-like chemotaxis protein